MVEVDAWSALYMLMSSSHVTTDGDRHELSVLPKLFYPRPSLPTTRIEGEQHTRKLPAKLDQRGLERTIHPYKVILCDHRLCKVRGLPRTRMVCFLAIRPSTSLRNWMNSTPMRSRAVCRTCAAWKGTAVVGGFDREGTLI